MLHVHETSAHAIVRRGRTAFYAGRVHERIVEEAEARQLPALIAEWSATEDERHWIARALRIDLALLTERPELVRPALYRRCAPNEELVYAERIHVPAAVRALEQRVRTWPMPARWLRALRPPTVPLEGAVLEEYRTSIRGTLWADGEHIGVAGEGRIAWDRATGRRVEGAGVRPVLPAPHRPWRRAYANTWGRVVLERGDERVEIAIDDAEYVRTVISVTDDLVVASGADLDENDFALVIDPTRARICWRVAAACSVARAGDKLALGHQDRVTVYDLASGEVERALRCWEPYQLVLLPDDQFATRSGSVIRVWSFAAASARPQASQVSSDSFLGVAFSPDGSRLVTGRALCDGRAGEHVAWLDCGGPGGWLEGGPPAGSQVLFDDVFAELMPWGLSLWDARTGARLVRSRGPGGRLADLVAYDRLGRSYALWTERGRLSIRQLRDGAVVAELDAPPADRRGRMLRFSADGEQLMWGARAVFTHAIAVARPTEPVVPREDARPPPARILAQDGLLVADGVAIPFDEDSAVVSPDGRNFASVNSHYRLDG